MEKNPDKIDWELLSGNPAAIHLLEKKPDKIDWEELSGNPAAIHLLEKKPDKIDWGELSENPAANILLEKNQDKLDLGLLFSNATIFELDQHAMRTQMQPLAEELIAAVLHPRRVGRILEEHGYNIASDEYWDDC